MFMVTNNYNTSVIRKGFEPLTYCLEGSCSIQLSYRTKSLFQLASLLLTSLSLQRLNLINICSPNVAFG